MKILIVGATGGTGRILVERTLGQGHEVTALARNPDAVAADDHRPRVLRGNALDAATVSAAVEGQEAVLSALGTRSTKPTTLFSASTANLIGAMHEHGVRRLVCLTGIGTGDSKGHGGLLYDRILLPFVLKNVYEDKDRQEALIRDSGLDWIIVRPARLTDGPATDDYRAFLGDEPYKAATVSREDVAAFMLAQLQDDRYVHQTPVVSY